MHNPFLFIVFLPFVALSLFFILPLLVYSLICFLVWRILPLLTPQKKMLRAVSLDVLKSLPYVSWVPSENTIHKSGVILYDKKLSFQGLNLYNSRDLTTAYLMDMSGNIVHSWTSRISEHDGWHYVELFKNGDLLANVDEEAWIKLGWNSDVKWVSHGRYHHDVAVAENQDIYTFARKDDLVFHYGLPLPILNECIVILSPEGMVKREIPLYKIVNKKFHFGISVSIKEMLSIYRYILNVENYKKILTRRQRSRFIFRKDTSFDIFHANSIEIIDRNIDGLCKRGDLLISIRQLNLIAILDIKKEEIIWSWGPGKLLRQHHPTLLENGNILVFDNRSFTKRRYSRVVELNPLTRLIVWEYKSHPPQRFFSPSRGDSQRLPNGNTLITNSDSGQVFEVTRDGEVVWEFYNPRIKEKSKKRAAIYRMMRIVDPENYPWLRDLK